MSRGNYINHATVTRIVERLLSVLLIHIKCVLSMVQAYKVYNNHLCYYSFDFIQKCTCVILIFAIGSPISYAFPEIQQ